MAVFGLLLFIGVLVFVVGGTFFYTEADANAVRLDASTYFHAPSRAYPLGSDSVGRNVLARCIYGGQISLMIGIISVTIAMSLGTSVGLVSGYFAGTKRGWIDSVLMRLVEALLSFPQLVLLLLLARWFA
jgi:peptide/nickel transport system permease protein